MSQQYLRQSSLFVSDGKTALDLSQLHFTFEIFAAEVQTPNNAIIRIFNASPTTEKSIKNQYKQVILQVGYQGGLKGVIFNGTIVQVRRGRANATDRYIDIVAADGDVPYNFAKVKKTLDGAITNMSQLSAIDEAMTAAGANPLGPIPTTSYTGGILPRGKVLYGMARDHMRNLARNTGTTWSFQNGSLTSSPLTGLLSDRAIRLTAKTGLIGMPEQTDNGIRVRCLINPQITPGVQIQLDNATINEALIDISFTAINLFADPATDGFYKVIVVEARGDTRGNEWYQDITCLAVNPSAKVGQQVNPYAG